jgi:serine-type D-Ala-D-Ala carboxypeptidase (penicillin-binding protein 5/6)
VSGEGHAPLMVAPFRLDALHEPPPLPPPRPERGRHAVHSHRRRHPRRRLVLVAVLLVLVAAGAVFVGVRASAPDPAPVVTPVLARTVGVPERTVTLPWPATGQGVIAIPALGVELASGPEQPAPVASLTKLMTAYVVLHDHPLAPDDPGPTITVTQADVDDYDNDTVDDDANAQVSLGEQLTEQQVMSGLLVHSADNYADLLARWDAGSIPAFVAKMNAVAARLGMRHSHWADPSGVSPSSVSTAQDILKVAAPDMANAELASIVKMSSVTLPVAGTISTYTPLLGLEGVVGVKSGFTTAAGGCDVLAARRTERGRPVLLLAAVTGQTGPEVLAQAGLHGLALVNAASSLIGKTVVLHGGEVAAHVSEAGRTVDARATASASMLTWPGTSARRAFEPRLGLTDQARQGGRVGTIVVTLGSQHVVVPVRLQRDAPRESLLQRIF